MSKRIKFKNDIMISAIYYGLLQSGYDYYKMARNEEHINAIQTFCSSPCLSFFADVKQNPCEAYPYWPRAALLESATFHLDRETFQWHNFNDYKTFVMSANNIQEQERDESFWEWVNSFPVELDKIVSCAGFKQYFDWESNWVREQELRYKDELSKLQNHLDFCIKNYDVQFEKVQIVLSAIKCVYSCDYHTSVENFIFSSGDFSIDSVLHEYLHYVVRPIVSRYGKLLINNKRVFDGIDSSYYLSYDENGIVNAFEEYTVRCLTNAFTEGVPPTDLTKFVEALIDRRI